MCKFQLLFITAWNECINFWHFFNISIECISQQHHMPTGHAHTQNNNLSLIPRVSFSMIYLVQTVRDRLHGNLIADQESQLLKCRRLYNHRIPSLQWHWHILILLAMLCLAIQSLVYLVPSILPPSHFNFLFHMLWHIHLPLVIERYKWFGIHAASIFVVASST